MDRILGMPRQICPLNFFDYSKTVYQGANRRVEIVCPLHGKFVMQKAIAHLRGSRCQKCVLEDKRRMFSQGLKKFLERAERVYPGKKVEI